VPWEQQFPFPEDNGDQKRNKRNAAQEEDIVPMSGAMIAGAAADSSGRYGISTINSFLSSLLLCGE
jgi:hypothetical protein